MSSTEARRSMDDVLTAIRRIMNPADQAEGGAPQGDDNRAGADLSSEDTDDLSLTDAMRVDEEPATAQTTAQTTGPRIAAARPMLDRSGMEEEEVELELGSPFGRGSLDGPATLPLSPGEGGVVEDLPLGAPLRDPAEDDEPLDLSQASAVAAMPSHAPSPSPQEPALAAAAPTVAGPVSAEPAQAPGMTEAEIEDLVRRVVREELTKGKIGQNISANIGRLVQAEIKKALAGSR